ncbi:zinc ribbon domain-containing protein [Halobacteriales archaeon QH_10_67_13]|nr:MAG: zinc ribbon domain-containing protein [Halobacteriales archaeon QH_10_67_13]
MAETATGDKSKKRPWLAAALAVLYPGLGHVYLRLWGRAVGWFVAIVAAGLVLVPDEAVPESISPETVLEASRALPLEVSLAILGLSVLSVVDAYWMAGRLNDRQASEGVTECPECGEEVDEELEFCQWCTTRLEEGSEDSSAGD